MRSEIFRLVALLLSALACAQAPRKAEASLQLLSGGEYLADHGFLQSDGQVRPIDISPDFLSERISYSGPARFEIRPARGKGSKKDESPPLAWFDLPKGGGPHRLILIVSPRPGSNGITAVNDASTAAARWGTPHPVTLCAPCRAYPTRSPPIWNTRVRPAANAPPALRVSTARHGVTV